MTQSLGSLRRSVTAAVPVLVLVLASCWFSVEESHAAPEGNRGPHPARIVWPGHGVRVWRASDQMRRLAKTSPGFRSRVSRELDKMFHDYLESDPGCAQAPMIQLKEYRRAGFAYLTNVGTFPGGPGHAPERCAGGGAHAIYLRINGTWRAPTALGGQEAYRCRVLHRFNIPRMYGTQGCYNARGEYVEYAG